MQANEVYRQLRQVPNDENNKATRNAKVLMWKSDIDYLLAVRISKYMYAV